MKGRRNPAKGPLLTFGLMIGSVLAVVVVSRFFEAPQKAATPTVEASTNSSSASSSR